MKYTKAQRAAQYRGWVEASNHNKMKDDMNPAFLFSMTTTELLVKVANGEVDARDIAKHQLAERGVDANGKWVGFDKAAKIHGIL